MLPQCWSKQLTLGYSKNCVRWPKGLHGCTHRSQIHEVMHCAL